MYLTLVPLAAPPPEAHSSWDICTYMYVCTAYHVEAASIRRCMWVSHQWKHAVVVSRRRIRMITACKLPPSPPSQLDNTCVVLFLSHLRSAARAYSTTPPPTEIFTPRRSCDGFSRRSNCPLCPFSIVPQPQPCLCRSSVPIIDN